MCGIAGIFAQGEAVALEADAARMISTLGHRGPDDRGTASGQGWSVGMTRLSIQDLSSAGHQPMGFRDLTLVFNGEVYNFRSLRAELERDGYRFHSGSDTEVVLLALHRWGMAACERFNGMFALALVDDHKGRAWLARDRFGKKPLYWLGYGIGWSSPANSKRSFGWRKAN